MTRSDIASINALFTESTYSQVVNDDEVYCVLEIYDTIDDGGLWAFGVGKSSVVTAESLINAAVAVAVNDFKGDGELGDIKVMISKLNTDELIVLRDIKSCNGRIISERAVTKSHATKLFRDAVMYDKTFTRLDYTVVQKLINNYEYKKKALQGSNDEAGLGDMLDVL